MKEHNITDNVFLAFEMMD
jgi:hypothetical protein